MVHTMRQTSLAEHDGAYSLDFCEDVLSGKYGYICQYDWKTNADTVWSAVYDVKNQKFTAWRATRQESRSKRMQHVKL